MQKKKTPRIKLEQPPGTRALTALQAHFVCNLWAQYKTAPEIQALITEIHGIKAPSLPTLYSIRDANIDKIKILRDKYLASIEDVPIAQDKVRLERIEALYQTANSIGLPKDKVEMGLKAIREARDEVKGTGSGDATRPGDMNFMQFNFNNMSDRDLLLLERKLKKDIIDIGAKKEG